MEEIFRTIVFIYIFANCCGCKQYWDTTCRSNDDCCSGLCYKESNWSYGVCKPEDINYPPKFNKCGEDFDNNCVVNEHCCSGLCEKRLEQKYGVCKPNECEPLASKKLAIICFTPSNRTAVCNKRLVTNSRAIFRCNNPIYWKIKEPEYDQITCRNGKWDRPLVDDFCEADCGRSISNVAQPSTEIGKESDFGEFPWNAGVFWLSPKKKEYEQVCGGTLISPRVVISVAHCFVEANTDKLRQEFRDLSIYKIGVGKYNRNFNASEDTLAQFKDIVSIEIPAEFNGFWSHYAGDIAFIVLQGRVEYSWAVLPICTDIGEGSFERDQLVEGSRGKIVVWGMTEEREYREKLTLIESEFVPLEKCNSTFMNDYIKIQSRKDKFCAKETENQSRLCAGSSGAGLVFLEPTKEKYYLRGVLSFGPPCHRDDGFTMFTKLSTYKELVERYLRIQ